MCVTLHKKYVPLMFFRAYRAAGLRVNMLKDNIDMDIKEMALMNKRTKNNLLIHIQNIAIFIHNI